MEAMPSKIKHDKFINNIKLFLFIIIIIDIITKYLKRGSDVSQVNAEKGKIKMKTTTMMASREIA